MEKLGEKMPNLKELNINFNGTNLENVIEFQNAFYGMK